MLQRGWQKVVVPMAAYEQRNVEKATVRRSNDGKKVEEEKM